MTLYCTGVLTVVGALQILELDLELEATLVVAYEAT